jgi:hypothetical protein
LGRQAGSPLQRLPPISRTEAPHRPSGLEGRASLLPAPVGARRACSTSRSSRAAGVCSLRGWMGARRLGRKREGLAQIGQGLDSYGLAANQHVLSALQADARLAIGKPEEVLASVAAGLKEKTGARCLKPSSIGSGAQGRGIARRRRDSERGRDGHRERHRRRATTERERTAADGSAFRSDPFPYAYRKHARDRACRGAKEHCELRCRFVRPSHRSTDGRFTMAMSWMIKLSLSI